MTRLAVPVLTGVLTVAVWSPRSASAASPRPSHSAKPPEPQPPRAAPPRCVPPTGRPSPGNLRPWAAQLLNFDSAWLFDHAGRGVTVAVVDSGVSAGSPQLAGRLVEPERALTPTDPAVDCVGHGTGVAGIIAAADQRRRGNPFFGVAPDARILSIKITDSGGANGVDANLLAGGILEAADAGAQIINVSSQLPAGTAALRGALAEAARRQAVVVMAAGNDDQPGQDGPYFPAEYSADQAHFPNVLSVGAIQPDGTLPSFADPKTYVSVVAPGTGVLTLAPDGTYQAVDGTSYAAPFVSGVAALVRAAHPRLTAAEVVNRIVATADGGTVQGTGAGLVDPLQAVTAVLPGEGTAVSPALAPSPSKVSVPLPPRPDRFGRVLVYAITGGALAAAALVVAGGVIIPAGRRRGWKPGRARPAPSPEPAAAEDWPR